MKAMVRERYGSPDVLRLEEVEAPAVGEDGVLVRVHAASVNPLDWHAMRGSPVVVRLGDGLLRPKVPVLGVDVAGVVDAVGANVAAFRPGDEVFGLRSCSLAELVCGTEANFAPKPANVSFEEAAAVPVAGFTALQGLRDHGRIAAGHKVLVNGASGGVGTFAVQIARSFDAHVTGVCSTRNVELVRSLGAERVVDYTREDFTRGGEHYDLIFDTAGTHSLRACRRVLSSTGTLVLVGMARIRLAVLLGRIVAGRVVSRFSQQTIVAFVAKPNKDDLVTLKELVDSGAVTPVIDRTYPLAETPEAIRYLEAGHARGKVVVTVGT